MVRLEREGLVDVAVERGTRLARDPEEHVEVQVGDARPKERGDGSADGLRRGAALEHRELARAEALGAERDTSAVPHQDVRERVVDGLGVGLHGELGCRRQSLEQAIEQRRAQQRGRAAADEDRRKRYRQQRALAIKLGEQRVNVGTVPVLVPRHRDEVAVAAAVRAEGDVDVQVGDGGDQSPPTWGISARDAGCRSPTR